MTEVSPSLSDAMIAIAKRDLLISFRARGDILLPVLFFVVVVSLFPAFGYP